MIRDSLGTTSSHYSLFMTAGNGLANQYRTCTECLTYHYGEMSSFDSVWLRIIKERNVLRAFYKPTTSSYWTGYGAILSINEISSSGYYVGIAVTSRDNSDLATLEVSNIQLTRSCSSETITQLQCDQAR